MTLKDLERILYFEYYVVLEPGLTPLQGPSAAVRRRIPQGAGRIRRSDSFTAQIGAEAIREMLKAHRP